jgi:hypothetical protein
MTFCIWLFDFLKYNTYTDKNALPIKHTSLADAIETETHLTVHSKQMCNFNVTVSCELLVFVIVNVVFHTYVKYLPRYAGKWAINLHLVNSHSKAINNFVHVIIYFHLFLIICRLMWIWKATKISLISKKSFQN